MKPTSRKKTVRKRKPVNSRVNGITDKLKPVVQKASQKVNELLEVDNSAENLPDNRPTRVEIVQEKASKGPSTGVIVMGLGATALIFGGGYFAYQKWQKDKKLDAASGALQKDVNSQLATRLFNALDANGFESMWAPNLYNPFRDAALQIAKEVKDWAGLQARYKELYQKDITTILNEILIPADYQQFIKNLSANGNPINSSGSGSYTAIDTGLKAGDLLYFNKKADDSAVPLYKTQQDYPGKPYLTLPIGRKTRSALTYKRSAIFTYLQSNTKVILHLVQIPGQSTELMVQDYMVSKTPNLNGLVIPVTGTFVTPQQPLGRLSAGRVFELIGAGSNLIAAVI